MTGRFVEVASAGASTRFVETAGPPRAARRGEPAVRSERRPTTLLTALAPVKHWRMLTLRL